MMEISLVRGRSVYSGHGVLPPELVQEGYRREYEFDDSSSDSGESDNERYRHKEKIANEWPALFTSEWNKKAAVGLVTGTGLSETREQRKERKAKKRAEKLARKTEKAEKKQDEKAAKRMMRSAQTPDEKPWKLIATYKACP